MDDDSILQTAQRNKQNYLDAKAAYNRRDLDACLAHYAPDHQIMSRPSPSCSSSVSFLPAEIPAIPGPVVLRTPRVS